ncbi:diguanylate cyclase domain-containing protein [uncultured Sphaerochaeta sp.]|uniref:diguanylate cyclase domain-containing protein n=1 Tax=uncultured Sphaerochaeta sp. TaxID=886478 RepID=UPI002A0A9256|nr:diguanylate cyclase [uncultured Sphaerochaeta sp.]
MMPSQAEIYRIGGDEFVCLIPRTTEENLQRFAAKIETRKFSDTYSVAVGFSIFIPRKKEKFNSIIHKADSSMYTCKSRMKQTDSSIYNTL